MAEANAFVEVWDVLSGRSDQPAASLEPLLAELWWCASDGEAQIRAETIEQTALGFLADGVAPSIAAEKVMRAGRMLAEVAAGRLDDNARRRLAGLVDGACLAVARSIEEATGTRRGAWLSFYAHELKNPLNTMLNALWLLRERGANAPQAARFIELAERAVKTLEDRIRDLRGIDERLGALPPGWEGRLHPKRQ